jgi:hypothetical protein
VKIFSHLRQYLAKFFLESEIIQIKVVERIKIHILCSILVFSLSSSSSKNHVANNVEKCGGTDRPRLAIWRRVACWISKATRQQAHACTCAPTPTHIRNERTRTQKYVILIAFPLQQCFPERFSTVCYTYTACLFLLTVCYTYTACLFLLTVCYTYTACLFLLRAAKYRFLTRR